MTESRQTRQLSPFWSWVCARRAHDNFRGDFIRDTRDLVEMGVNPGERILAACPEAMQESERLRATFSHLQ